MSSRLRSHTSSKISFFAFQDIITSVSGVLILVVLMLSTELDRPSEARAETGDPEIEQRLRETLMDQSRVDQENRRLQQMLAAAETAPDPGRLLADVDELRSQLDAEELKYAGLLGDRERLEVALEDRDRALGLLALRARVDRAREEVDVLAAEEVAVRAEMEALEQQVIDAQAQLLKVRGLEGQLWLLPGKSGSSKEPVLVTVSAQGVVLDRFDHPDQQVSFARTEAIRRFRDHSASLNALNDYFVFLVRPSGIPLFEELLEAAKEEGFEVGFDALEEDRTVHFSSPPTLQEIHSEEGGPDAASGQPAAGQTDDAATAPPTAEGEVNADTNQPPVPVSEKKRSWWRALLNWLGVD